MFDKFCIRHSDQILTHFCSNQLCPQFLTFYCTQCEIKQCNKNYHLQQFDNLSHFINKLSLPNFDTKQIEYCQQQMNKIISNFNTIQEKIINDYDKAIEKIIEYIQNRSSSFKTEIISQIDFQKEYMIDKLTEFTNTMDKHYNTYKQSYDQTKSILNAQESNVHIEEHYRQVDMTSLQEYYNVLLRMQPELEVLAIENSLQITKEQQIIESFNHNIYKEFQDKIIEYAENILTLLWSKYYSMTSNIHLYDNKTQSIAQSEMIENIRISRSSSSNSYSVFNEIDNIIAMGQQFNNNNTSIKLKSQSYGYTKFNLMTQAQLSIRRNHLDNQQQLPIITPHCILVIKNQHIILTAGDSNTIYVWIHKKESNLWRLESQLQLQSKEQQYIQCMELLYNPFISESRNSKQSFANLKVLLNPIIAVCGQNNIYIVQFDIMTNQITIQCQYTIKDQKEQEIHTVQQCQTMGSYNYFIIGMEKGTMILFNYIISIDNTFTIKIDQIIKQHKDCITSIEIIGDQLIAVASNDRSVSIWQYFNNKLRLSPIKLNRFWEDIPCLRQVYTNSFITFDSNFNITQWYLENLNKIVIINSLQSSKLKQEVQEAVIINNPDNAQDFCIILLIREQSNTNKIVILDRYFSVVSSESLPQQFQSYLSIPRKKHNHYITNYKMRIINDLAPNKGFSSFVDVKQNEKQPNQQQQQSFSQQQQMNQNKKVNLAIINNNKTNQHFIEISYIIGTD
ncbi:unnamed protein product (macronuclear) [Paramecium tetraurelia]|uniref:Uncharacterized protein n=1 Tax=Paramecium tetraurelia TaxID=5888 RepID=A0CG68_PARTE|nr:uncharacterized protein GSPATT00038230001 [Paramecium tetraurelia]CAK69785.1 unnamed protein product [Paramecium tetraurelia]|eukprot:XP_001437182.1 hypothetical protein (macronuclear) [Paramecium tetraurelia strain d4-2]